MAAKPLKDAEWAPGIALEVVTRLVRNLGIYNKLSADSLLR